MRHSKRGVGGGTSHHHQAIVVEVLGPPPPSFPVMIMTIITTWISTRHEDLPRPPRRLDSSSYAVDGALRRRGLIGMSSARGRIFRLAGRACVLNLRFVALRLPCTSA